MALLHWNGRWHVIKVPFPTDSFGSIAQDGHGGVWMLAFRGLVFPSLPEYLYHYGSGRWIRQAVPAMNGTPVSVRALTWIPRTRSLWAIGDVFHGSDYTGVIMKDGP